MKKLLIKCVVTLAILSICACTTQTQEKTKTCKEAGKESITVTVNKAPQNHSSGTKKFAKSLSIGEVTSAYNEKTESTGPKISR
jgi:maltose-binding protein MalE